MRGLRFIITAFGLSLFVLSGCDNGRDTLLANLQSTRPEERALAVKKLAEKARPEDLVLFTSAAKDPASIVRAEAAQALGKSQDERVVDLLGDMLGDDSDDVQANAAMALAEIKTEKAKAYLTSQYARRGRNTRIAIVQALKAANVPGAMAGVVSSEAKTIWDRNLEALTKDTLPEQVAAAEELGKSGRAEAVTRLLGLLKDSQVMLAAAAVRGLGYAGDHRAVQPISELLNENFPELRESACNALMRLQDPQALPKLQEAALEKSATSSVATAAILEMPRQPDTDKALCVIALDGSAVDALAVGRELRKRGGCPAELLTERWSKQGGQAAVLQGAVALGPLAKDWLPKILPLLQSSDPALKLLAVRAIGAIGDASAAPTLQKLYDSESKNVDTLRADWVTGPLPEKFEPGFDGPLVPVDQASSGDEGKGKDARGKFDDLFRRLNELNKARNANSNKKPTDQRAPTEVVDDVTDDQVSLLAAVLTSLGELNAPGALELLKPRAKESSPLLRQAAMVGLIHLGPEGIELARAGLFDADRDVQTAVAGALGEQGEAGQSAIAKTLSEYAGDKLPLLDALGDNGATASAAGPLIQILKEGGAEAAIAARLLGELKSKEAVDPLMKNLQDPTSVARREVLIALGKIGDSKAAELISKDLYDDSPDVRAAAAEALGNMGAGQMSEPLDALKGDYYRRVRELAEGALSRLSNASTVPEAHK
ncbi:MAG: HEAT repeat domain-containing protein [Myxococcaceae bacterium]